MINEYIILSHQYMEAVNRIKSLSAEKGLDNKEAAKAINEAKELHEKLKAIDAAVAFHNKRSSFGGYGKQIKL